MLDCKVNIAKMSEKDMLCGACKVCEGKSKFDYPFEKNLENSDDLVEAIMEYVEDKTKMKCEKTKINKNPDINVFDKKGNLICRIEAKYLEGQAFMVSKRQVNLYPREALAVDEPKLDSYVECKARDRQNGKNIPIYVVWKFDRPCADLGGVTVFQEIDELERLRQLYGRVRAYEREVAKNDYVGTAKMGVTKKYHYSIRECFPIEELPNKIISM